MSLAISNFHGFPIAEIQRLVETEHHFPDVRKMVPAGLFGTNAEAWELEVQIAENVVGLLETA
jgi:hypothetical protein